MSVRPTRLVKCTIRVRSAVAQGQNYWQSASQVLIATAGTDSDTLEILNVSIPQCEPLMTTHHAGM